MAFRISIKSRREETVSRDMYFKIFWVSFLLSQYFGKGRKENINVRFFRIRFLLCQYFVKATRGEN
jgi:hypothetical protein